MQPEQKTMFETLTEIEKSRGGNLFNLQEGQRLKTAGMERAVEWTNPDILAAAREYAHRIAFWRHEVTSDDVYQTLQEIGLDPSLLGNAAGSIFKGKQWECIGWRKSSRASNHTRMIRVWRLKP